MKELLKNTVKVDNQLKEATHIKFINLTEKPGLRVMFVGNSITRHGIKPEIGWYGEWGMAASSRENDYVHICIDKIQSICPDTSFCICQVWQWEKNYTDGENWLYLYEKAKDFHPDIIIMRAVENCSHLVYEKESFKKEYGALLDYLGGGNAKILLTSSFWYHPANEAIEEYSAEKGYPLCMLSDLGESDDMKAVGLFEYSGVANHPGDLGMRTIAERIMETALKEKFFG